MLTEEDKERLENGIEFENDIQLCSAEKLFSFTSIEKFKLTYKELMQVMKSNNYEFTKSDKYIMHRLADIDNLSRSDSGNYYEENYDEINNNGNSLDNSKINSFVESEENWDDEIENGHKPIMPERVFSPREQFGHEDDDVASFSDSMPELEPGKNKNNKSDSPPDSSVCSSESSANSIDSSIPTIDNYEVNYNASKCRDLSLQFYNIRRRLRREERRRLKKEQKNEDLNLNIEQFLSD